MRKALRDTLRNRNVQSHCASSRCSLDTLSSWSWQGFSSLVRRLGHTRKDRSWVTITEITTPQAVGVRFRILDLFFRTGSRLEDRSNVAFVWRRHAKFEMLAIFVGHGAISSKACAVHGGPSSWCGTYWSRKAGWAGGFCLLYQFTKADSEFVMLCIEQLRAETPWLSSALRTSSSVSLLGHPTHPVLEFSELSSKKNKN